MSDPRKRGGSSEPNGPNERAHDAAEAEKLSQKQADELQRELERRKEELSYREIRKVAREIKGEE